jgi:flagellar protein FliS
MNNTYDTIGAEAEVVDASPHRLVQMLLERCVQQIHTSRHYMEKNDIVRKGQCISKAMDIIAYLKLSLNMDDPKARELSKKMDDVYSFVDSELLQANMTNDPSHLDAALNKILIIKSAWDAIGDTK